MSDKQYTSKASGLHVLYIIATADGPVTSYEIADLTDATVGSVQSVLTRLYRSGYVVRRQKTDTGPGGQPYEYAIQPRPEDFGE